MSKDQHPDLTIVLLGQSGVGKSASGNTILGRSAFKSEMSCYPVTKIITEETVSLFEKQISVVDTPGILDSNDAEKKITEYCQELLRSGKQCLFLVTVKVGHFREDDKKAVRAAERALGCKGVKKSYLLFTGGDTLKKEKMTLEDFLLQDKDESLLPDVVQRFAGAFHLFDNKDDNKEQVRKLLLRSGHLRTQQQPISAVDVSKDRRVVLLGRHGSGKSSSGNSILGSDWFRSGFSFNPVSTKTVAKSATVEGRRVTVVDTPGFTDEVQTPEHVHEEIMKTLVKVSPGPHAFVIVVKIERVNQKDVEFFELLPKLFDSVDALQYSMVLFTHGERLKNESIEDLIKSNKDVSKLVSMCGGRYCVFDNKTTRRRQQSRGFLQQVDEIVIANGGQHFTNYKFGMAETFFEEENNVSEERDDEKTPSSSGGSDPEDPEDLEVWNRMKPFLSVGLGLGAVTGAVGGAKKGGVIGACVGGVAGAAVGAAVGGIIGVGAVGAAARTGS